MMNTMVMKYIVRNGARIFFWTNGRSDKPAIFFLHGAGMDHEMFADQIEAFTHDYHVIAWDARGHGASKPVNGDFTVMDMASDALSVIDDQKVPSVTLIGQSEGSLIAQCVLMRRPLLVDALVSIGGSPITMTYSKADMFVLRLLTFVVKAWPYRPLVHVLAKRTAISEFAQSYARQTLLHSSKRDLIEIWKSVVSGFSIDTKERKGSNTPLLITYGYHDNTGHVKKNNSMWTRHENSAELVVIPDAGHNANQDNPLFFNSILKTFLEKI